MTGTRETYRGTRAYCNTDELATTPRGGHAQLLRQHGENGLPDVTSVKVVVYKPM